MLDALARHGHQTRVCRAERKGRRAAGPGGLSRHAGDRPGRGRTGRGVHRARRRVAARPGDVGRKIRGGRGDRGGRRWHRRLRRARVGRRRYPARRAAVWHHEPAGQGSRPANRRSASGAQDDRCRGHSDDRRGGGERPKLPLCLHARPARPARPHAGADAWLHSQAVVQDGDRRACACCSGAGACAFACGWMANPRQSMRRR